MKRYCVLITNGYGKPLYRSIAVDGHDEIIKACRAFNRANKDSTHNARTAHVEDAIYCQDVAVDETLYRVSE